MHLASIQSTTPPPQQQLSETLMQDSAATTADRHSRGESKQTVRERERAPAVDAATAAAVRRTDRHATARRAWTRQHDVI